MAHCGNSTTCEYIAVFCDGNINCENSTDEGRFCGKTISFLNICLNKYTKLFYNFRKYDSMSWFKLYSWM